MRADDGTSERHEKYNQCGNTTEASETEEKQHKNDQDQRSSDKRRKHNDGHKQQRRLCWTTSK